jgi:type IV pilus assembly protein PilV
MHPMKRTPDIVTSTAGHFGNTQQGFTLLEVLIALLVLSIGLLGLAALQTTGLRSNEMASMRTTSTMLAYDITDRMRANPAGRGLVEDETDLDGDGNFTDFIYVAANDKYPITVDTPTSLTEDCDLADCDPTELATYDLFKWRKAVELLPGGKSDITVTVAASTATHIITVYWDENRTGATGLNCPPINFNDLRCFRLVFSE